MTETRTDDVVRSGPLAGKPLSRCSECSDRFRLWDEHHDWLLAFERKGFLGVVEMIAYLEVDDGCITDAGLLGSVDFGDFVASHNWEHPGRVWDFAMHMRFTLRRPR